jgi:hypothetical protein
MNEYIALFVVCVIIIMCICGLYLAFCGEYIDDFDTKTIYKVDTKTIEEIDTPL